MLGHLIFELICYRDKMVQRMCIINCRTVNGGVLTGTGLEGLTKSFKSFWMVNLRGNTR